MDKRVSFLLHGGERRSDRFEKLVQYSIKTDNKVYRAVSRPGEALGAFSSQSRFVTRFVDSQWRRRLTHPP